MKADIDDDEILQLAFSGIAIALAHDGKTRQELASELTHLEEANSEKHQDETEVESTLVEKGAPLIKLKSPNFYVSPTAFSQIFFNVFYSTIDGKQGPRRNRSHTPVICLWGKN